MASTLPSLAGMARTQGFLDLVRKRKEAIQAASVDAFFQDGPGKGPVHGTRIDIQVMDPVGQDLGDTALARSGRPINGNRQFSHGMHSFVAAAVPATKPVEKAACRL